MPTVGFCRIWIHIRTSMYILYGIRVCGQNRVNRILYTDHNLDEMI